MLNRRPTRGHRALLVCAAVGLVAVSTYVVSPADTSSSVSNQAPSVHSLRWRYAPERPQAGWRVASKSARGVMVDYRNIRVGTAVFRAVRLRARTTLLRWHVGAGDPTTWQQAPADAGSAVDWSNEGPPGVVALFNGAFKQGANAGGSSADHVTFSPLVKGDMTLALNAAGHWEMGVWGWRNFPTAGFGAISERQNLGPLVLHAKLTSLAASPDWRLWGDPLHENPLTARTGLGVDRQGNLIYVATMTGVLAPTLGRALIAAGAVRAMQLDINPYWPILGVPTTPLHGPGPLAIDLPSQQHSASTYFTGWERDFFVSLAEPNSWTCHWVSRGLSPAPGVQPQLLRRVGRGCSSRTSSSLAPTP